MLHPFIPFFTEKIWLDLKLDHNLKNPLMFKDWSLPVKTNNSFQNSYKKIDLLIQIVTNIRSIKVDLQISPGSYIEISIADLKKDTKTVINDNLIVFKRLARVTKIHNSKVNKNGVTIIVESESITLYFDEDVNLSNQKQKLLNKATDLESKVTKLKKKLENKSFLDNAPKSIVLKEKNSLSQYNIELKKLNSILNSIKN